MNSTHLPFYPKLIMSICLMVNLSNLHALSLGSPAFQNQSNIPQKYACDGLDMSPPLFWRNSPAGTKSYVLLIDDADAPNGTWVHWLVFNIPSHIMQLPEGAKLPDEALVGINSWGQHQYGGPCPPSGTHHYIVHLYALNTTLSINSSVHASDIQNAMQNHILAETSLIGLYSHKPIQRTN